MSDIIVMKSYADTIRVIQPDNLVESVRCIEVFRELSANSLSVGHTFAGGFQWLLVSIQKFQPGAAENALR